MPTKCEPGLLPRHMRHPGLELERGHPGNVLDVETGDGTVKGRTASLPFFDPKKIIPSSLSEPTRGN